METILSDRDDLKIVWLYISQNSTSSTLSTSTVLRNPLEQLKTLYNSRPSQDLKALHVCTDVLTPRSSNFLHRRTLVELEQNSFPALLTRHPENSPPNLCSEASRRHLAGDFTSAVFASCP